MKILTLLLVALCLVTTAFAAADVTYNFDQNNVSVQAYDCLDADCSEVSTFSGSLLTGASSSDGKVTIRYPDALATQHGYIEFFTATGYRPLVGRHNWHTHGQSGIATTSESNTFTKYPNTCRATVEDIKFARTLEPHKPLVVNLTAGLDAQTSSAFKLYDDKEYVPSSLHDFWSADTTVKFEVLQNGTVKHTQQRNFTDGNAIMAGSRVPVSFAYLPVDSGDFMVRVTTNVTDDACTGSDEQKSEGTFTVLSEEPAGQCYTLVNNVNLNNTNPNVGETVKVSFDKISNYAYTNGTLLPAGTDVDLLALNDGSTVYSLLDQPLVKNDDTTTASTHSFEFTPTASGQHTIHVRAESSDAICGSTQIKADQMIELYVDEAETFNVTFSVVDNTGAVINDSTIVFNSQTKNTTNGTVSFTGLSAGTFAYKASTIITENLTVMETMNVTVNETVTTTENVTLADGTIQTVETNSTVEKIVEQEVPVSKQVNTTYSTQGNMRVFSDQTFSVVLDTAQTNSAPLLDLPPSISMLDSTNYTLDLNKYVMDDRDLDSELVWTITSSSNVNVTESNGIATFVPTSGFSGTERIYFTVNDTSNETASDSIAVRVVRSTDNTAPKLSTLPSVILAEDSSAVRVIDLFAYTADAESDDDELTYIITTTTSSKAGASIADNRYVTVTPSPDFNGGATVTVQASDGSLADTESFTINVTSVNDAPRVISIPTIPTLQENETYVLNLSSVFEDIEGDTMTFTATSADNLTLTVDNVDDELTIDPDFNVYGNRTFNVTAKDSKGLTTTASFSLTLSYVDNAPIFRLPVDDIVTFEELSNSLDFTVYEADPEEGLGSKTNSLTWTISNGTTTGSSVAGSIYTAAVSSTEVLTITPKANQTGTENLTVILTDSQGHTTNQTISVTILPVNDAPVITSVSDQTATINQTFNLTIQASDVDGGETFTWTTNSTLFNISTANSTNGFISFTPSAAIVENILVTATDPSGASANETFKLTVQ